MLLIITLFLLIGGFVAITSNPDTFSPAKFLLAFYLLFHVGAFVDPPNDTVVALMAVPLFLAVILVFAEGTETQYLPKASECIQAPLPRDDDFRSAILIWVISLPSIWAQYYMISEIGGFAAYVASINSRVQDWSGFGWALVLIGLISSFSVVYLAIGLMRKRSVLWWALFFLHFVIVIAMGLLSGSRGGTLNIIALLIVTIHYARRSISLPAAVGLVVALVGAASLLGIARNGLKVTNGELSTGFATSSGSFSFNSFYYGVEPLELIASMPHLILAKGSTFLSLVTNVIPRSIYPDKPDTGGVFFTKNYAGDAWEGLSNLTPTFMGEWIINFGYLIGIIGFFVTYGLIFFGLTKWYARLLRNPLRPRGRIFAVDLAIYLHALWTAVGLLVGELTNIVLGFVLTQLIPLIAVRIALTLWGSRQSPQTRRDLERPWIHEHQPRVSRKF